MTNTINQTTNGIVFTCNACSKIHFEYKNLNFLFTKSEYKAFSQYIQKIDAEFWEFRNQHSPHKRKVLIPIGHRNLKLGFNKQEIKELKTLFSKNKYYSIVTKELALEGQYSKN